MKAAHSGTHSMIPMWKDKKKLNSYVKNFPTGIGLTLYKGNFEKYKGKFSKSVFCNFKLLNPFTSGLMVLIILEVLTDLITPILPYLRCNMAFMSNMAFFAFLTWMTHLASDICYVWIWQYGCQKMRLNLRNADQCH